jgi:broad specificity polyphosphatase/5'/3'-nucleotidase SurE
MNPGGNFGNVTNHSGTVGAAVTAIENRIPGIAVSIEHDGVDAGKAFAAEHAARPTVASYVAKAIGVLQKTRGKGAPLIPGGGLNINYPIAYNNAGTAVVAPRGARITRIGTGDAIVLGYVKTVGGDYDIKAGICGAPTPCAGEKRAHADTTAITDNWISISPLDGDWSASPPGALAGRLRPLLG